MIIVSAGPQPDDSVVDAHYSALITSTPPKPRPENDQEDPFPSCRCSAGVETAKATSADLHHALSFRVGFSLQGLEEGSGKLR